MKTRSLKSPRIQFNFGFHDGTQSKEMNWPDRRAITSFGKRFAPLPAGREYADYRAGYSAGRETDISNGRPETSDLAWKQYKG